MSGESKGGNGQSAIGNREFEIDEPSELGGFFEGERRQINDHRDLDVWKLAMALTAIIYRVTKNYSSDERFGLISQMRRAAVSIPANIAEGYGRESKGSYLQFLRVSQGSARELETLVELSATLGFLAQTERNSVETTLTRVIMMLRKLIKALEEWREK